MIKRGLSPFSCPLFRARTFWDKVIILPGVRQWFERRHELRQEGQRVSRH